MVKFSWPAKTRMFEEVMIIRARDFAVKTNDEGKLNHLPNIIHPKDKDWSILSQIFMAGPSQ